MPKIGIFWIYRDTIVGKARNLEECHENISGLLDSPDEHSHLWESIPGFTILFPELSNVEYQEVPRGRVIYSTEKNQTIVYMDKLLHSKEKKRIIIDFFQLQQNSTIWKTDLHYTTDSSELNILFRGKLA